MSRFIFRCKTGAVSDITVRQWNSRADVTVIERTARMLLVETTSRTAQELAKEMPEMVYTPESTAVRVPDTRPHLEGNEA